MEMNSKAAKWKQMQVELKAWKLWCLEDEDV